MRGALMVLAVVALLPLETACGGCPRTRGAHVRSATHPSASDIAIEDAIEVEVVPGPPIAPELDVSHVHAVVVSQASDVRRCFESARAEHPALEGAVALDVAISADGAVHAAALAYNETGDGVLGACLVSVVERWHFPGSTHGARVRLPFRATDPPPAPQPADTAPAAP